MLPVYPDPAPSNSTRPTPNSPSPSASSPKLKDMPDGLPLQSIIIHSLNEVLNWVAERVARALFAVCVQSKQPSTPLPPYDILLDSRRPKKFARQFYEIWNRCLTFRPADLASPCCFYKPLFIR